MKATVVECLSFRTQPRRLLQFISVIQLGKTKSVHETKMSTRLHVSIEHFGSIELHVVN